MAERRPWTQEEDEALKQIYQTGVKKWTVIAKMMEMRFQIFGRTGKQCRQRWFNQLNPQINNASWSKQQQDILFKLHSQIGNSWSKISQQLKGRTDNQIKNHFYSNVRKAFRRLNRHLISSKAKQLKMDILNKLLSASEDKFDKKLKLSESIVETSISIKNKLLQLSYAIDLNTQNNEQMNELIKQLVDFSKTWRRKKKKTTKKSSDNFIDNQNQSMQLSESSIQQTKNVKKKNQKNTTNIAGKLNSKTKKEQSIKQQSQVGNVLRSSRIQSTTSSMMNGMSPRQSFNRLPSSAFSLHSHESEQQILTLRKKSSSHSSYSVFGGNAFHRYNDFDLLPRAAGFNIMDPTLNRNFFQYPPESLIQRLDD